MEMKSYADLLDLQDVDAQIDRLLYNRETLPELALYKSAHESSAELAATEADAAAKLKQTNRDLDRTQGELGIADEKLNREQLRLYSGGMSAREADYLRREVEMLRTQKSTMEDELLALMEAAEEQEALSESAQDELASVNAERDRLGEVIKEEWKEIDAELGRRENRKGAIVKTIEAEIIELYEELRRLKDGVGAAALEDGTCSGCHLSLTATEQIEAKRSEPPRCIHCRRILVI